MLLEGPFSCLTRGNRLASPMLGKAIVEMSSPPGKHGGCLDLPMISLQSEPLPGRR